MTRSALVLVCGALGVGCGGAPAKPAPAKDPRLVELGQLMKNAINPAFSKLTFLVFHGDELGEDPAALQTELITSVTALRGAIGRLRSWTYPPTSTPEGKDVFYTYAAAIEQSTQRLETAVGGNDGSLAQRTLEQIATTCNNCHHFFRLDIEDSVVGPNAKVSKAVILPSAKPGL